MIELTDRFLAELRSRLASLGKDIDCVSETELKSCMKASHADAKKPTLEKLASKVNVLSAVVEQLLIAADDGKLTSNRASEILRCLRYMNKQVEDMFR